MKHKKDEKFNILKDEFFITCILCIILIKRNSIHNNNSKTCISIMCIPTMLYIQISNDIKYTQIPNSFHIPTTSVLIYVIRM